MVGGSNANVKMKNTINFICKSCVLKAHKDLNNPMAQIFIQNFNQKTQRSRHKRSVIPHSPGDVYECFKTFCHDNEHGKFF